MPRVSVVVVTYNARPFLEGLVGSLQRQTFRDFEIVFVDNASSDGTADLLPGRILRMDRNLGFAAGCNAGVRAARAPLVFLLNQDTVLDPRCLEELVSAIGDADLCGAKMRFWHEPGILNSFGYGSTRLFWCWDRGLCEFDRGQYDETEDALGACGGAMMVRRDAYLRLGGFDESFFMYQEDVDFCHRAAIAGCTVALAEKALVYHKKDYGLHPRRLVHYRDPRNRLKSLLKNVSLPVVLWVGLAHLLIEVLYMGYLTLRLHRPHLALLRAGAILWNVLHLPSTWAAHERVARLRRVSDARFFARLNRAWFPKFPIRPPDHKSVWNDGASEIDVGHKAPEGLGTGWGKSVRYRGRRARRIGSYGLAYFRRGIGLELTIAAVRPSTARVFVNGIAAGMVCAEPGWRTVRIPIPFPRGRNRILLEISGEPMHVALLALQKPARPELEHQQQPQPVPVVARPGEVLAHEAADRFALERAAQGAEERVLQKPAPSAPQPLG